MSYNVEIVIEHRYILCVDAESEKEAGNKALTFAMDHEKELSAEDYDGRVEQVVKVG
jgi:hypothetical protein